MNTTLPSSVTIEEAVARMVNLDYIPTGFTLLEMTAAFEEEAETDYENARTDRLPEDQIASFKLHMDSCKARHALAQLLMDSLHYEVKNREGSMIVLADDTSSQQRLTLESVSDWASEKYGIGIPEWGYQLGVANEMYPKVSWEDMTIKIWKNHHIGLLIKGVDKKRIHFRKINLMGIGKNEPNELGKLLLALSDLGSFPTNRRSKKFSTSLSKLRTVLRKLTGLRTDPFHDFHPVEGWKSRFRIVNDENNAEDRMMKRTTTFDDALNNDEHQIDY